LRSGDNRFTDAGNYGNTISMRGSVFRPGNRHFTGLRHPRLSGCLLGFRDELR